MTLKKKLKIALAISDLMALVNPGKRSIHAVKMRRGTLVLCITPCPGGK